MSHFFFAGELPASKSLLNRWNLLKSFSESLRVCGHSECEDVLLMRKGIEDLRQGRIVDCGSAGTVFRFLTLRASRIPGQHLLTGSSRLLSRPHKELTSILQQLGVTIQWQNETVIIEGNGWIKPTQMLELDPSQTSQFVSGLLLNAWDLDFDLEVGWQQFGASSSYFQMSLEVSQTAGMQVRLRQNGFVIPKGQTVHAHEIHVEPDMSSAFSIAVLALLSGEARIKNFPSSDLQPDRRFIEILRKMRGFIELQGDVLYVRRTAELQAIEVDLNQSPDLFPILAVLCSAAKGKSVLRGAPQLRFKESDRVAKVSELLTLMKVDHTCFPDGIEVTGQETFRTENIEFDPDQDHRMAMAAQAANYLGCNIRVQHPEVVDKSFPEFWQIAGGGGRW